MTNLCQNDDPLNRAAKPSVEARQQAECANILAAFRQGGLSEAETIHRLRALLAPPPATNGDREREAKRFIFANGYERSTDSINVLAVAKLMVEFAESISSPVVTGHHAPALGDDQETRLTPASVA